MGFRKSVAVATASRESLVFRRSMMIHICPLGWDLRRTKTKDVWLVVSHQIDLSLLLGVV